MYLWVDDPGGNVEHIAALHRTKSNPLLMTSKRIPRAVRRDGPAIFGRTFKGDTIFVVYDLEIDADGSEFVYVRTAYITED